MVEIYDFGELPDGRLFICMELLDGKDLVPATETEVRPPAEVLAIFRQLCKALGAAHKAGIVHRDIKPENIILVRKGGRDGVVKVVDFGISAVLGQERRGKIAGTPHYMAPEQIRGHAFDGRLDMYAAGCVAFELLTGSPPFPSEALEEVLNAHVHQPPPSFRQVRPDLQLPAQLEQVVLRCLSKQPGDRYADMHELEAALCEAQIACGLRTAWDDLPLPECAPDRLERLRARMPSPQAVPRRWLWPVVAGVSLVAAGVAVAVALRTPTRLRPSARASTPSPRRRWSPPATPSTSPRRRIGPTSRPPTPRSSSSRPSPDLPPASPTPAPGSCAASSPPASSTSATSTGTSPAPARSPSSITSGLAPSTPTTRGPSSAAA
ncbi:serine/threonine-protein kinase [Nannocystis pusilla]|uniref:serine/threonine-protein kinase n=1 Tax=Nannocystis pusilla TaxID=889268 RepID=UPI003B75EEB4